MSDLEQSTLMKNTMQHIFGLPKGDVKLKLDLTIYIKPINKTLTKLLDDKTVKIQKFHIKNIL